MGSFLLAALAANLFTLDVRVRDAVEGGPVVLDAMLTYHGDGFAYLRQPDQPRFIDPLVPPTWPAGAAKEYDRRTFSDRSTVRILETNEAIVERLDVHKLFFGAIPPGPAEFRFTARFDVWLDRSQTSIPVVVRRTVTVPIRSFTPAVRDELVEEIAEDIGRVCELKNSPPPVAFVNPIIISRSSTRGPEVERLVARLVNPRRPEFVPQALTLYKRLYPNVTRVPALREFILHDARGARALFKLEVRDLLENHQPGRAREVFSRWRERDLSPGSRDAPWWDTVGRDLVEKPGTDPGGNWVVPSSFERIARDTRPVHAMPDDLLDRLKRVDSVWERAFVYVTFGEVRLGRAWCDRFLADLRAAARPEPPETMARWLAQLDADDYLEREKASQTFVARLDVCRAYLEAAEQTARSPEVKWRIKELLKKPAAPFQEEFLGTIQRDNSPAAARVGMILSAGGTGPTVAERLKAIRRGREEAERERGPVREGRQPGVFGGSRGGRP
ncbi:hypothetical protein [Fimbriiglobus ruber]|uniref:Uncharacterized protein n=1 Tax=Fimbriiglobus ruber TaxID=1908690 RepID=A0A225E5U9_9BACT|nr:hypothetical protein [Fimbriiglobus ruber]OWK45486.1 hypothetical protein FRUB_01817 [Fimbriiglobus ruber]